MKRFQITEQYKKAIDRVIAILAERGRGSKVTHAEIAAASGFSPESDQWDNLIVRLKSRARRVGMVLWCKEPHSYHVLTAAEALEVPAKARTRRASRQCTRAIRETECTPDSELTAYQRDVKHKTVEALRAQRRSVNRQGRAIQSLKPSSAFGFHPAA